MLYTEELHGLLRSPNVIRILQLFLFIYLCIIYIAFLDYDTESMLDKTRRPKLVQHLMQHPIMKTLYNDAFSSLDCISFIEMIMIGKDVE